MILYSLICGADHVFDVWFKSSGDFDKQSERGLVSCPVCGSAKVSKSLMAPSVSTSKRKGAQAVPVEAQPNAPPQMALPADPKMAVVLEAMRRLKSHVTENADYVGPKFAEEARKIHYGEAEERGIYGETTAQEAENLREEGIDIHPLPVLPDETN